MNRPTAHVIRLRGALPVAIAVLSSAPFLVAQRKTEAPHTAEAIINVDGATEIGRVPKYLFGQNLEHEHGTISGGEQNDQHAHGLHSGGLWAEMLRDRKFEEGDLDLDGVANAWVPEERITNRYYELHNGQGTHDRYRVDHDEYYGGGASQAVELYGDGSGHASIYQIKLHFAKGKRYMFYVYLKARGAGRGFVEFGRIEKSYFQKDFGQLSENWQKYEAEFTAPEDTGEGRVRIGVTGAGTFWIDSASLMPADNFLGMRRDVVEAVKPLKVPVVRYPGGCFADTYHWKDGIGDRDKRPERWSLIWNEWEPNDFGLDEFMQFAEAAGFEAHITANYLTGSPEEAAQWVEYANGTAQTELGRLRAKNGHPQPYGIKLWAVGNEAQQLCSEMYGGLVDVHEYAKRFDQYASAMRAVDPSIEVIAVGSGPGPLRWNHDLLQLEPDTTNLGVSIYTGDGGREDDFDTKITDLDHFYRHVAGESVDFNKQLEDIISSAGGHFHAARPLIAVTEFQSWWLTEKVDADLRLCNALYLASVYNAVMRHAHEVYMLELESLVNVQGILEVNQTAVKLTPEYFASLVYREHIGANVLATTAQSPTVSFNPGLPALDAIATLSADGKKIYVGVVNRSEDRAINTSVRLKGWAAQAESVQAFEVNGESKVAANPFGDATKVNIQTKPATVDGSTITYQFPPHSVTVIEVRGK